MKAILLMSIHSQFKQRKMLNLQHLTNIQKHYMLNLNIIQFKQKNQLIKNNIECLKQSTYWTHYAASPKLSIDDMAMMLCRDIGCEVNYCGLVKKSQPMEWEGSSDQNRITVLEQIIFSSAFSYEIKNFSNCMTQERRRYQWQEIKPPMFDYIQNRLEEKRKNKKFANMFTQQELEAIEKLKQEDKQQLEEKRQKEKQLTS